MDNRGLIKLFEEKNLIENRLSAYILYNLEEGRNVLEVFKDKEYKDYEAELECISKKINNMVFEDNKGKLEEMFKKILKEIKEK